MLRVLGRLIDVTDLKNPTLAVDVPGEKSFGIPLGALVRPQANAQQAATDPLDLQLAAIDDLYVVCRTSLIK